MDPFRGLVLKCQGVVDVILNKWQKHTLGLSLPYGSSSLGLNTLEEVK